MKKLSGKLDRPEDLPLIEKAIVDNIRIVEHYRGDDATSHPAPEPMNKPIINAILKQIELLLIKKYAIEAEMKTPGIRPREKANYVHGKLMPELTRLDFPEKFFPNNEKIQRYIRFSIAQRYIRA